MILALLKLDNAWLTQGGPAFCIHALVLVPRGTNRRYYAFWSWADTLGDPASGEKHWSGRGPEPPGNCGLRTDTQNRRGLKPPVEGRGQIPRARPREYAV